MIDVYTADTRNGVKIPIALEEIVAPYRILPVNLAAGEQKRPDFLQLNPNGRIPAIVDHNGPGGAPASVFESGAILLYLAEKFGGRRQLTLDGSDAGDGVRISGGGDRADLQRPSSYGLVTNDDPALGQHLLDHPQAQREAEVEPYSLRDDRRRISMVTIHGRASFHASTLRRPATPGDVTAPLDHLKAQLRGL